MQIDANCQLKASLKASPSGARHLLTASASVAALDIAVKAGEGESGPAPPIFAAILSSSAAFSADFGRVAVASWPQDTSFSP